jgi:hypothetical protein
MPAHPELEGAELSCRVTSQNDIKRNTSECMNVLFLILFLDRSEGGGGGGGGDRHLMTRPLCCCM